MSRTQINPWTWQDSRGYSQAWRTDGATSFVFVAGQGPIDSDGSIVGPGDFRAQARKTFENLQEVLAASGAGFDDVVKLGVYLTDMSHLPELGPIRGEFITGRPPASTAVAVAALALPNMMIEIDAVAAITD